MSRDELTEHLKRLDACAEARDWAVATPGTPEELWAACPRGDWLLWLAASAGVDRRAVVLAACDCAETATPYLTDSTRGLALAALETARRWARGEATDMEVHAAVSASYAAVSATYAAYAAHAAAYAAHAATYAAYAAHAASLERSADLVRARIPWADVEGALLGGAS